MVKDSLRIMDRALTRVRVKVRVKASLRIMARTLTKLRVKVVAVKLS